MKRLIPFALLALAAVAGVLGAPSVSAKDPSPAPPPASEGSVKVDARLESTRLHAERELETYARIVLEGKEAPAPEARLPLSLTLVIDRSGSMSGGKIEHARSAALRALDELERGDRVSVVAFSSGAEVLARDVVIGASSLDGLRRAIARLPADGGTNMAAALDVAAARARAIADDGRVNRLLLLSDGQPDTEEGLKEQVAALARRGIHTTTLGIGRDYNEDLMARLADAGLGNYYFIESPAEMTRVFAEELSRLASVVAKEAVVTVSVKDGVEVLEVFGWESSRGNDVVAIPVGDVYGGKRAEILARLRVPRAKAGATKELVDVKVSFHDALDNTTRRVARPLVASFTADEREVLASLDTDVARKAEEVRTARALDEATAAYARGDKDSARAVVAEQKARVQSFAASAGAAYAPAAEAMAVAMDDLESDVEEKADLAVASKKAKAAARGMRR